MLIAALALVALTAPGVVPTAQLTTVAERSGFQRTGRYDEVVRLCDAFAAAYPQRVQCLTFGTTPEGRAMKALVVGDAAAKDRPVIFAQGGIHAGEIDGKDAGFLAVRDLLDGKLVPGVLDAVTFVFVPVFNVDGHERFGPNNRPNQRGPVEMGWRTTSWNLNLNRDYMKADAPEMHAMLALLGRFDPVLVMDLHVTDGAKFQHDVAVMIDPAVAGPEPMHGVARTLSDALLARLRAQGHPALDFYPSFAKDDDPQSGVSVHVSAPRFSGAYWSVRGRMGMLVETHSWKTYPQRVKATYDVLAAVFAEAQAHAKEWQASVRVADAKQIAGEDVVLTWQTTADKRTIDFLGYAYKKAPSPVSGAERITYDEGKPEVWQIPLSPTLAPALTIRAPRAGYVVPRALVSFVKPTLDRHGVSSRVLSAAVAADAEVFRADEVKLGEKPFEGRMTAKVKGAWTREKRTLEPGALFVPATRVAVHLLEPMAPDSFVSWGTFNAFFEQKEYMESYVAEEVAERMVKDPKVRAAFDAALKDPAFAASPERRLDFFYRRHPSWDGRKDVYPVLRLDRAP